MDLPRNSTQTARRSKKKRILPKKDEIKWLFFDVGSTLVDESKVYEDRMKRMETIWVKQGFGSLWNITDESEKADMEINNLSDVLKYL